MQQTRQCLIRLVDLLQRYILGDRQLFVMVHLGSPLYNIRILLTVPFASGTGAAIARTSTSTPVSRSSRKTRTSRADFRDRMWSTSGRWMWKRLVTMTTSSLMSCIETSSISIRIDRKSGGEG